MLAGRLIRKRDDDDDHATSPYWGNQVAREVFLSHKSRQSQNGDLCAPEREEDTWVKTKYATKEGTGSERPTHACAEALLWTVSVGKPVNREEYKVSHLSYEDPYTGPALRC